MLTEIIRKILLTLIPEQIKRMIVKESLSDVNLAYSQEGEDLVLAHIFTGVGQKKGFYIDIGAHHPSRFSNTYKFYLDGWRGINIDAMPGSMKAFNETRELDVNLEIPVAKEKKLVTYYSFNEPALNTFDSKLAIERNGIKGYKIIKEFRLETKPLSEILDIYLPKDTNIDFMSVDVEGMDFEVLQSNNWEKYLPKFIIVESLTTVNSFEDAYKSEVCLYLMSKGYILRSKTNNSLIFQNGVIK